MIYDLKQKKISFKKVLSKVWGRYDFFKMLFSFKKSLLLTIKNTVTTYCVRLLQFKITVLRFHGATSFLFI